MGQWKPYKCIAKAATVTQSNGTTDEAKWPIIRATGDANVNIPYRIVFPDVTGGSDQFYVIRNVGKANQETIYADLTGTDNFIHSSYAEDGFYASIGEGVEMRLPTGTLVVNDAFDFTVPELEKSYDGGIHGFCQIGFDAGNETPGSGIIYSDNIPFEISHVSTWALNSRNLTYTYNSGDILGNAGTAIDLQWTVDGTNYFDGFELSDDLNFSVAEDRGNHITIYDKGDSTGTPPKETGGDTRVYRLKIQFENLTGGEKQMGRNQFLHIAIYNH